MQERERIILVIIAVVLYNLLDHFIFKITHGIWSVIVSIVIAIGLYLTLIYFFGKKHMN